MRKCKVCGGELYAKGFCKKCYQHDYYDEHKEHRRKWECKKCNDRRCVIEINRRDRDDSLPSFVSKNVCTIPSWFNAEWKEIYNL